MAETSRVSRAIRFVVLSNIFLTDYLTYDTIMLSKEESNEYLRENRAQDQRVKREDRNEPGCLSEADGATPSGHLSNRKRQPKDRYRRTSETLADIPSAS